MGVFGGCLGLVFGLLEPHVLRRCSYYMYTRPKCNAQMQKGADPASLPVLYRILCAAVSTPLRCVTGMVGLCLLPLVVTGARAKM